MIKYILVVFNHILLVIYKIFYKKYVFIKILIKLDIQYNENLYEEIQFTLL